MERYFTELEAASAAGVSPDTIREFASIGILRAEEREGQKRFSHRELEAVFQSIKSDIPPEVLHQESAPELKADEYASNSEVTFTAELEDHDEGNQPPPEPAAQASPPPEAPNSPFSNSQSQTSQSANPEIREAVFQDRRETFIEHNSFEFLELNKTLRDQIQILRDERDWLRKRVEVLEVRAERDQMLLLSESRNLQNLLPDKRPRRWFALPWSKG